MVRSRYGIMIAVLFLTSIILSASAQTETAATTSAPDKTSNPGDVVKITGPTGSYTYTWTISPSVSPAPTSTTAQAFSFTVPKTSPAPLYTVTLLVKSTVEGSCTNSRVINIAVNMPIAISGKKSVCVTAANEPYSIAPDLTAVQTIEWSLDGTKLDATKYGKNPITITWADFASGITAATTKNLVAIVKDSAGNVVSTAPTFPVVVVPIPVTTITIA
ncbi:MAG: hypothetical protein ACYDHX_01000 [Methanothrix sp.]